MKILFVDQAPWDYAPDTPLKEPIGGSQSALCYLAVALAGLGYEVGLLNHTRKPGAVLGVRCFALPEVPADFLADCDAVVVVNNVDPGVIEMLRPPCRAATLFFVWTGHAADQPAIAPLEDAGVRDAWDGFVLVSDWQAVTYAKVFGVPRDRIRVLRNAIAPAFQNLFAGASISARKPWPPVLAYSSTPFRGLDRLVAAVPTIRNAIPGTRLQVFSSMALYRVAAEDDQYRALYDRCRATDGIEYVGPVDQPALAAALGAANCLAYPNTFAETSCIAVMEAMAAGCLVVTSDLGALAETTAGHAQLIEPAAEPGAHAKDFAAAVIRTLLEQRDRPDAEDRLRAQVDFANQEYTWAIRAREWGDWLVETATPPGTPHSIGSATPENTQ